MTLTEFLLARIAEDEDQIRDGRGGIVALSLASRIVAECEAKRRIVELHRLRVVTWDKADDMEPFTELLCTECGQEDNDQFVPTDWPCSTLRLLALPYYDHSDFRDEWKPAE